MSLEITLQNAISGLQTSKTSLQVISNNIANVNTEGYTRKIIQQTSRVIDGNGYGVEIAAIKRNVDEGILRQFRKETGSLEQLTVREDFLSQINAYFGRPEDNNSIAHVISELAAQMDALAVTPETSATQFLTVRAAIGVVDELDRLSEQVQLLRTETNNQIDTEITKVNSLLDSVVDLNFDVVEFIASNISTSDLEDQRDIALNSLSEILDFQFFEKGDGSITLFSGGGSTLIDGQKQTLSYAKPSNMASTLEYTPTTATNYISPGETGYPVGGIPGIFVGDVAASGDATAKISSGRLSALIEMRDSELPAIQSQLDELAEKLKNELNAVHNSGAGFPPPPTLTGDRYVASGTNIDNSTGLVRIGVVDDSGAIIESFTFDLTDANITTVGTLLTNGGGTGINDANQFGTNSNLTASINSAGQLTLAASNNYRIAINELTSSMSAAGDLNEGFSDFFGLNNFFSSTDNYGTYRSDYQSSTSSSLVTTAGSLQFTGNDGAAWTATVAYSANDTLTDLETKINANATLGTENITADIVADGSGFRLEISDSDGDKLAIVEAGAGSVLTDTNLRPDTRGLSNRLSVRSDIVTNTFYVSRGALQSNTFNSGNLTSATQNFAPANLNVTAGNLTFTLDSSTTASVAYTTASTLNSVVTSINSNSTLAAAGITAEVVISGTNYSLKIIDGSSDNFWISDSGGLSVTTSQGVTIGDGSVAEDLAAEFETIVTFSESPARGGGLPQSSSTFSTYASNILSSNSAKVSSAQRDLQFQENLTTELFSKNASISGVNMDEELANMIVYEQAYMAAARMISATEELYDALIAMVGR